MILPTYSATAVLKIELAQIQTGGDYLKQNEAYSAYVESPKGINGARQIRDTTTET